MALINCPECGKEISDTSKKCINCGYRLKAKSKVFKIFLFSFLILAIITSSLFIYNFISQKKIEKEKLTAIKIQQENSNKEEKARIDRLSNPPKEYLVAADGYLAMKSRLKNPDSLQLHKAILSDNSNIIPDYIMVVYDISAQNGFGGMNRSYFWVTNKESDSNSVVEWDSNYNVAIATKCNELGRGTELDTKYITEIAKYLEENVK